MTTGNAVQVRTINSVGAAGILIWILSFSLSAQTGGNRTPDRKDELALLRESGPAASLNTATMNKSRFSFIRLFESFTNESNHETIAEIERAVFFFRDQKKTPVEKTRNRLDRSMQDLSALAYKIKKGDAVAVSNLKMIFGTACIALAKNEYYKGKEHKIDKNSVEKAFFMRSALAYLAEAYIWLEPEPGDSSARFLRNILEKTRTLKPANDLDEEAADAILPDN